MASTYEIAEPQAPEDDAPEQEPTATASKVVLLPVGDAIGVCDLDGECR